MISIDLESNGLWPLHGCQAFSIGLYDGKEFKHTTSPIDPLTRKRTNNLNISGVRRAFNEADIIVMHNAHFDLKFMCEAGVFTVEEVGQKDFWKRIFDTTILAHLNCSTDDKYLDTLAKRYLGEDYPEDKRLNELVNKCRTFVRSRRPDWYIADKNKLHPSLIPAGKNTKWGKMDYWLPAAVARHFPESQLMDYGLDPAELRTVLTAYLRKDCITTYDLAAHYFALLVDRHQDQLETLLATNRQVQHITWRMETKGVYVHEKELKEAISICSEQSRQLLEDARQLSGLERITDATLRELLFDQWQLEPLSEEKGGKTKTGRNSVSAKVLTYLRKTTDGKPYEFLTKLLAHRKYEKKLQYLQGYNNSRNSQSYLCPSFNIVGTKTLRFSSNNPNAQNVGKAGNPFEDDDDIARYLNRSPHLRSVFGPPPGLWWLSMDYSQLQLRIFAVVTNEIGMQEAFRDGWDAHDYTTHRIFQLAEDSTATSAQRRIGKNTNFGFIFGASPRKIEQTAGQPGLWNLVCEMFPNAHQFIETTKAELNERGYVETIGGYPLDIPVKFNERRGRWEKKAHSAVNYIVQGTEGEIVKRAMAYCQDYLDSEYPEGRIVLQVHDEIDFETPAKPPKKHLRELKHLMEKAASDYGIFAPVECDVITRNWNKGKKVEL